MRETITLQLLLVQLLLVVIQGKVRVPIHFCLFESLLFYVFSFVSESVFQCVRVYAHLCVSVSANR